MARSGNSVQPQKYMDTGIRQKDGRQKYRFAFRRLVFMLFMRVSQTGTLRHIFALHLFA